MYNPQHKTQKFVLLKIVTLLFVNISILKAQTNVTINPDNQISGINSMVGFLHWRQLDLLKSDIKQLKPKYWRFGILLKNLNARDSAVNYLISQKITPVIVLSDYITANMSQNPTFINNPKDYYNIVTNLYKELGNKVIYDIWNEPNLSGFFRNKQSLTFFNIFKRAHDIIRSMPGGENAQITGPSIGGFSRQDLQAFLQFCNTHDVKVDILNWHDDRHGKINYDQFKNDIQWVKDTLITSYPNVGVKKILLTEILSKQDQYSPFVTLMYFKIMEEAGVDGACKACWENSKKITNCIYNNLDGILTEDYQKRAIWWAYYYYTQSVQNRISSISVDKDIYTFAFNNKQNNEVDLLLMNNSTRNTTSITIQNSYSFFNNRSMVKYEISAFPESGESPITSLPIIKSGNIKNTTNNLNLKINGLTSQSAYLIRIF